MPRPVHGSGSRRRPLLDQLRDQALKLADCLDLEGDIVVDLDVESLLRLDDDLQNPHRIDVGQGAEVLVPGEPGRVNAQLPGDDRAGLILDVHGVHFSSVTLLLAARSAWTSWSGSRPPCSAKTSSVSRWKVPTAAATRSCPRSTAPEARTEWASRLVISACAVYSRPVSIGRP